ncbi:winged helix-turn-helix domain-containing protein [Streptomyces enissocaesilis]|uniref:winged helix-turn-helix domain-containing protein n=1 Tax=Streptomyces enissocaesilis TaxID=332589 RepID=UPI0031DA2478
MHFTHEDIAKTHMAPAGHQEAEALFALELLAGPPPHGRATPWISQARAWMRAHPFRHPDLQRARELQGDLLPLLLAGHDRPDGTEAPAEEESRRALTALSEFRKACVTPYQASVQGLLRDMRRCYSEMVADHGLATTLERMQHRASWAAETLSVADGTDREVYLDGRGLAFLPSVFHRGAPRLVTLPSRFTESPSPDQAIEQRPTHLMVFPVCPHGLASGTLVKDTQRPPRLLPQLLGRTRAAVLSQLTRPRSTSELSGALRISVTTASEHASVLRGSGLIATIRNGNSVLHEVTPLGAMMLNSPADPARLWCPNCAHRLAGPSDDREAELITHS